LPFIAASTFIFMAPAEREMRQDIKPEQQETAPPPMKENSKIQERMRRRREKKEDKNQKTRAREG